MEGETKGGSREGIYKEREGVVGGRGRGRGRGREGREGRKGVWRVRRRGSGGGYYKGREGGMG